MNTAERDDRLADALLAYQKAVEAGRRPERVEFLRGYPDLAAELEPFLSAGHEVGVLFSPLKEAIGSASSDGNQLQQTPQVMSAHPSPAALDDHVAAGTPTAAGTRFRRLRTHARGNLGEVFVAVDTELNREVALKEIQQRYADRPESRARFLREAEITGSLEHPGIVPVYGLGTYADGRPFYAMRLIRGDSLKEAIARFHHPSATPRGESSNPAGCDKNLERGVGRGRPGGGLGEL